MAAFFQTCRDFVLYWGKLSFFSAAFFTSTSEMYIQNPVEHLRWSLTVEKLHLRFSAGL